MRGLTVLGACAILACAAPAAATPPAQVVPGEVVVGFEADAGTAQRARALAVVDAEGSRALGATDIRLVQLGAGDSVGAAVRELERLRGVRYAEPNYVVDAELSPNDPLFADGTLFGLLRIGAPAAWDSATGNGVTVGVVDTGIAAGHEDLAANTVPGRDFVALGGVDSADYASHGTHVAGTIAAAGGNSLGVVGVAFGAHVQSLRALGADGSGTTADVAEAFAYAGAAGIRIVNASLGTSAPSAAIADAIALAPNTLFVVSAGNSPGGSDNDLQPTYPCSLVSANVICVAASDSLDRLAAFSHYGLASVDLAAPGVGVVSTVPAFADALHEDFEGGALPAGWTVESGGWSVISGFTGGALVDSPGAGADYVRNSDARVVSPPVATPAGSECAVEYRLRLRTADEADALVVEAGPSAAGPWQQLAQLSGSIDTGAARLVSSSFPTGPSTTWHVRLRFVSGADFAVADGAEVGELALRCVTGSAYASFDGTSMAAPHVAGAAALLLSRNPALGSTELRDALLQGAVPVPDLAGRVATGGRLDVARALAVRLLPVAKTGVSESDANAGVVMRGSVDPRGEATTFAFEYGPTAAYGSRTADATLVPSSGAQEVNAAVSGLALGATYHVRLVARSAGGTVNGDDAVFATVADLTDPITRIRLPACPKPFRKATCKRFRGRAKAWKVLSGTVSDRKPSSGVARVEVAVTADRVGKVCRGFDGHRLIRLRCGSRRFVPARLTTAGWSLRLGSLPNGRYQVRVRGRDGAKNVEGPKAGRNTLGFTIERR